MAVLGLFSLILIFSLSNCEQISNLPGLNVPINFKQYSGYITIDESNGKKLFYWYVESQSKPATDPLVLWLNGGPGCSSLGGFLGENGPFTVLPNITLTMNPKSWNKISNTLFLESPVGVGFSKTDVKVNYGDDQTATDSLTFLVKFFQMFPHLQQLPFWMTGESYAGHYIPTLVGKIVEYNKKVRFNSNPINLKGVMIGNALTSLPVDNGGILDYQYSHQLISTETYRGIQKYCNNYYFPYHVETSYDESKCNRFLEASAQEMGNINAYDIYADVCLTNSPTQGDFLRQKMGLVDKNNIFSRQFVNRKKIGKFYPCSNNFINDYLNDPHVQKAIHAEPTEWTLCNNDINLGYSQKDFNVSMLPFYTKYLLNKDLKVLIYTGDVDTVVPATSTRRWFPMLDLKLKSKWQFWTDSCGQVGGYTETYEGLTFATVRNAGHEVPTFQPGRAYDMFSRFLHTGSVLH